MLSLILLLSCGSDESIDVSCEHACLWVFEVCGDASGAFQYAQVEECLDECAIYPTAATTYAECLSPYVVALPLSADTCQEPFMRDADGSDIPCPWFTPCDPDTDCGT